MTCGLIRFKAGIGFAKERMANPGPGFGQCLTWPESHGSPHSRLFLSLRGRP